MKPKLIKDLGVKQFKNYRKNMGLYECPDCKKHYEARTANIKSGISTNCGCVRKQKLSKIKSSHNLSGTPIYTVWINMKSRCYDKNKPQYKDWGGRGIEVCEEWKNDFMSFYNWAMKSGYKKGLSIDRIDNNGNYEPSNCRFTNRNIQSRNTRKIHKTNKSGYRGVWWNKSVGKWEAGVGIDNKNIYLGCFKCRLQASYAYDQYVSDNNTGHTMNFN